MGEENDLTHTSKEEIGGTLEQRKAQLALEISEISDHGVSKLNVTNSRQMKEFCRYFTYVLLLGAAPQNRTIWSVSTTSHEFMNHAGNILRTQFQVSCWVFWSRVLIHSALRGRKQVQGDLSQLTQPCFPEGLRCAKLRLEDMSRGTCLSIVLETNQQNFSGTDIHVLKTHHGPYC